MAEVLPPMRSEGYPAVEMPQADYELGDVEPLESFQVPWSVIRELARDVVQKELSEKPQIESSFMQLSWSGPELLQEFSRISSKSAPSQKSSAPPDYMDVSARPSPPDESGPGFSFGEEALMEQEDDPDEFNTEEEALAYATALSVELLEEILAELAREEEDLEVESVELADKQQMAREIVFPAVWAEMG